MGRIFKRNYRDKAGYPRQSAPLRKIVQVLMSGEGMFGRDKVLLECGHTVMSNGIYKAKCMKCITPQPPTHE